MPKAPTPPKAANKPLIDKWIEAPEGSVPAKLHLKLDVNFKKNADRYQNAIMVARGIPFDRSNLTMMDWVSITYAKRMEAEIPDDKARAQKAIQMAAATYDRWEQKAEEEAWTLAMLVDGNSFSVDPLPYDEDDDTLPGIEPELNPQRDLNNPTERRIKQILDFMNQDPMFRITVQTEINGAIAEAIKLVETDIAGFPTT